MEHACDRCGATVNQGTAFCPSCGAPQIRVQVETEADESPSPAFPTGMDMSTMARGARAPSLLQWRLAMRCALVASGTAAVLGFLVSATMGPFAGLIAWTIGSGIIAVAMYTRRMRLMPLPPGAGARIGALTGVMGFVLVCLLTSLQLTIRGGAEFRSLLQEQLRHSSAAADPAVQPWVDYFLSPGGMAVMMLVSLVFTFALFVGLSSVGGMIGSRIGGRRR